MIPLIPSPGSPKDRIPRVKIKIGANWGTRERRDLERVALAREAPWTRRAGS